MNLSFPFIKRPVMTTLIMLPLILFGIVAYKMLPVSTIPVIEVPTIQVTASYPGASPGEMGRQVAGPLERQFMLMQGIEFVTSENDYENTTIILQFHEGTNIDVAASEVQNAIDKATGQLPQDLPNPPTYTKSNPSDTPILYAVIHSDRIPDATLYDYGYSFIGQQIGTIDGVADIDTYGYPYAVRVKVDPEALASRDISLKEVANAINQGNPDMPTGKFYGSQRSITTRTYGQLYKASDYDELIIKYQNGSPVRVKDVGKASASLQNDKSNFSWITKTEGAVGVVVLAIFKQPGYNTLEVCQGIESLLDRLKEDLPAAIELTVPFTQSTYIKQSVDEVEYTLLIAFCLVVAVVFIYLGKIRNSVIPLITLPITITGTFILMYVFGYSLDIMSLSAITLSIGFLVDDAIVVLENIVRFVQKGEDPYKGAINGSKQIMLTVISISLCLCAVFLPMLFLGGSVGKIFHEFSAVIIIAVLFSAFISLSLTPMLCSRFVPSYQEGQKSKMEKFSDRLNDKLLHFYQKALKWSLDHKKSVLVFCGVNLIISLFLFKVLPKEFLPPNDLGVIQGFMIADQGTSPERMEKYLDQVTDICIKNKNVDTMARMDSMPTDNQAMFFINLIPTSQREDIWKCIANIREELSEVIGIIPFLKAFPLINLQVGSSTSAKGNYQFVMQSMNPDSLYESAEKLMHKLEKLPELTQVSSDMQLNAPTLDINILRDQAWSYSNLNALSVENALMYAYGETYISKINRPENMYYVILEAEDSFVKGPENLNSLYLGRKQDQVSIQSVIESKLTAGPAEINHVNTMTSVTISFDVSPSSSLSQAMSAFQQVAGETLPQGVIGAFEGGAKAFKKTFFQLTILLLIAIFAIYIILGILYENFLHPLTALSALPATVFGGLFSLFIFGQTLSIYALIGLIMLIGIVIKNGILVIDFALEEMETKKPYDAIYSACSVRFRPIIMTTLAAMMGSVPIALGLGGTVAKGRAPLGIVVVGGLIFAQLVTLFVIPVFYLYMVKFQQFLTNKYALCRPGPDLSEIEKDHNL